MQIFFISKPQIFYSSKSKQTLKRLKSFSIGKNISYLSIPHTIMLDRSHTSPLKFTILYFHYINNIFPKFNFAIQFGSHRYYSIIIRILNFGL